MNYVPWASEWKDIGLVYMILLIAWSSIFTIARKSVIIMSDLMGLIMDNTKGRRETASDAIQNYRRKDYLAARGLEVWSKGEMIFLIMLSETNS